MGNMKIKAKEKNGVVKVLVQISHPMMTYAQAERKGIDTNFITHVLARVEGKTVYELSSSQFISRDPILKFKFHGKKGQILEITWTDMSGNVIKESKKIK